MMEKKTRSRIFNLKNFDEYGSFQIRNLNHREKSRKANLKSKVVNSGNLRR